MFTKFSAAVKKTGFVALAIGIAIAALLPILSQKASAATYTQLTNRSIQLSNSATSATGTTYQIKFTTSALYTINTIAIEICTDPFAGTTCTAPDATFNWNASTATLTNKAGITDETISTANSTATKLVLTRTAASVAGSTAFSVEVNGVTNPSTLGTYFARMYTLNNATGATNGALQDAGGAAMSTANVITITAKVQEALTFCAYTTGTTCSGATGTALNIGDSNGVLSDQTVSYKSSSYFNVYSNASTGVVVRMKGTSLTSGANVITPQGTGTASCVADSTSTAVEQFGFRVVGGTNFTPSNPTPGNYLCTSTSHNFDATNMASTYGLQIGSTGGPTAEMQNQVEYNAKASTTTKPGIYTTAMTFIATGTY